MGVSVTYYCPTCGTIAAVERDGYLDDKSVTPYPLEGWTYDSPAAVFSPDAATGSADTGVEAAVSDHTRAANETEADGVRFVCGDPTAGVTWKTGPDLPDDVDPEALPDHVSVGEEPGDPGCGEPFYLSFIRFENGREIDADTASERVRLAESRGHSAPSGPDGPGGPDTSDGGFY